MSQYFGGVAICQWFDECLDILVQKSCPNHTQPLPPSLQHLTYGRNHWQLATPFVWPFTADLPYEGCCSESRGPDSLVHIKLFFFTFYSENMPVPDQRNYQPSISVYVKLSYKYLYRQDNSEVPAHQRSLVIASVSIYFSTLNLNVSVENNSMTSIVYLSPELSIASQHRPQIIMSSPGLSNSHQQCRKFCLPSSPILFSRTLKVAFDFLSFEIMTAPKWMFVLVTFLVTMLKFVTEAA